MESMAKKRLATGPPLTNREREVRSLVAAGLSNKNIADRLGISPRNVAVHVSSLLTKTGCGSRTELAVQVLRTPWPGGQAPTHPVTAVSCHRIRSCRRPCAPVDDAPSRSVVGFSDRSAP
jgi:DNA-binding CsgD family transcriptional regulator